MFRRWITTACLLSGIILSVMGQGIRFEAGTFAEAMEKARKENKILFIDAYAVWCGPCKKMSNTVFKEAEVGKYTDQYFVAIKIDVERGEGPSIKTRYAIGSLPGYIFIAPDGNVILRDGGSMPTQKFMDVLAKARECAASPNNLTSLAARYESEKTNEEFLKTYLEALHQSGNPGYYEVVEQYLSIQKSMQPESKEMVDFLYKHASSLTYGGEADRILLENFGSEKWDLYVRKNIRETFQKLPAKMSEQTTEYAIMKKDSTLLDVSIERCKKHGLNPVDNQRERLLIYFYQHSGQGEKYKQLVGPDIEAFYNSLDVQDLREKHKIIQEKQKSDPTRKYRSYATVRSTDLRYRATAYAPFIATPEEKAQVVKWAKRVYDLVPDHEDNVAFYAKALYLYGDKQQGVELMEKAVQLGTANKNAAGLALDYEAMKAGKEVRLELR